MLSVILECIDLFLLYAVLYYSRTPLTSGMAVSSIVALCGYKLLTVPVTPQLCLKLAYYAGIIPIALVCLCMA